MAKKALKQKTESISPLLMDRAIVTVAAGTFPAWAVLTKDDRLLLLTSNAPQELLFETTIASIKKVRGLTSTLKIYIAANPQPLRLQFLPVLRNPRMGPDDIGRYGAAGNVYQDARLEKWSNIKLWASTLRGYNLDVRYTSAKVFYPLAIGGAILGMVLLAFFFLLFQFAGAILSGI